jgi:SAM-dependent methyltransferase
LIDGHRKSSLILASVPLVRGVAGPLEAGSVAVAGRASARWYVDDVPTAALWTLVVRHRGPHLGTGLSYKGLDPERNRRKGYRSRFPPSIVRPPRRPQAIPRPENDPSSPERFREADSYRAHREWRRYEGTGQRDLYRELRERFLVRHAVDEGWVLDLGSGPGRFLPFAGQAAARRVALDISREMLNLLPEAWVASGSPGPAPDRVLGNALHPPFERRRWAEVVVFGNTLGFAGKGADRLLDEAEGLVAPGGVLLIEIAPAPGERSRYLARLPPSSVARLLRSAIPAVLGRLDREGFRPEPPRRATPGSFRRFTVREVEERLKRAGWEVTETVAVAPALGPDPLRIAAARADAKAWPHLLQLEEEVGRRTERWAEAAAVLLSARRPSLKRMIK